MVNEGKPKEYHLQSYIQSENTHPVIHWECTELWDALRPLHQQEELLLHGLAHVPHTGDLLGPDVTHGRGQG